MAEAKRSMDVRLLPVSARKDWQLQIPTVKSGAGRRVFR